MEELLHELEKFKYNLNMSELEDYRLDERVNEIISIKEEIEKIKIQIAPLVEKIKDENNYKMNGQAMYDQQRRFNLMTAIKEAEIKENENNSLIQRLKIEITYGDDQEVINLKKKELAKAESNIDELRAEVNEYKDILERFEKLNANNDDINRDLFEREKRTVMMGTKLIKSLESREKFLSYDYNKELNNIITEIKSGSINFEEAKEKFNLFKSKIDEEFLDKDLDDRQAELIQNREAQLELENQISELQLKLSNKENYYNSLFVEERNKAQQENWKNKVLENQILIDKIRLNIEKDDKDEEEYNKIIEECEKENLELGSILRSLNDNENDKISTIQYQLISNREAIKEAKECIKLLITSKQDNINTLIALESKHERLKNVSEKLNLKQTENSINKHQVMLDENKLSKLVASLNALKNRENLLKTSIHENIDNINNINPSKNDETSSQTEEKTKDSIDVEEQTKEPQTYEIMEVKRPLKDRIKNKLKKVAKVIAAALTATLLLSSPAFGPQGENIETPVDPSVNQEMQVDNENIEQQLEENIKNEQELKDININDYITINQGSGIYKNQYDSTYKNNAFNPLFAHNTEREVIGISLMSQDGKFMFVKSATAYKKALEEGCVVTAYLTGKDNKAEGFWNVNDVNKVMELEKSMEGGMTR